MVPREVELVHDTRDISYSCKGESTLIPRVTGDYCPACGEAVLDLEDGDRYSSLIAQFHYEVRERLGVGGQPEAMLCPTCGGASWSMPRATSRTTTTAKPLPSRP